jgi:hypothetical protein
MRIRPSLTAEKQARQWLRFHYSRSIPKPLRTSIALHITSDPKVINSLSRHHRQLINFNSDRWLTANSLTPLQRSGGGDDEEFYWRDGILVLGIDPTPMIAQ